MLRVCTFFVVVLALYNAPNRAGINTFPTKSDKQLHQVVKGQSCQRLIARHYDQKTSTTAMRIYEEAFKRAFDGEKNQAEEASICAAQLLYNSSCWPIEAKNLFHRS